MRYTSLRRIDFSHWEMTAEQVLAEISQEGKEHYREILTEMLGEIGPHLHPTACWREIRVLSVEDDTVHLCRHPISDPYLAARLQGIRTIKVFQAGIADETWHLASLLTDPLDHFLGNHIMSACFQEAFRRVCLDMTRSMPKGAKLFMDNPGITGGWGMEHQATLLDILFDNEKDIALDPSNPFAFAGIIYTSNLEDSTRTNIRYMQADELVRILYQTAGILPPDDL